jgi:hypothetical protein
MKKQKYWQLQLGLILLVLSFVFYDFHYYLFHDLHHILIYLIGDIAFLPIEVLIVTLIIHQLLNKHEKNIRLEKLNMVIGTFFSEVGTSLLTYFSDLDPGLATIKSHLVVKEQWDTIQFADCCTKLTNHNYEIDTNKIALETLKNFLQEKRDFLLRLLENPNLLEHESFTELLRAVFHLTEELAHRKKIKHLSLADNEHIAKDIKRVYGMLVIQWLHYMQHLKQNFPYLFSLAMRTNPFDETASPEIK